MTTLSEIADKSLLPEWPLLTGCVIGLLILILGSTLARRDRRLALLPVLLTVPLFWFWLADLTDPVTGPMLLGELGWGYLAGALLKIGTPCLVALALLRHVIRKAEHGMRQLQGLCASCGYDRSGLINAECPECGTAFFGTRPTHLLEQR